VVQLRRLDNEQTLFLLSTNWSTNSFTSVPVAGLPAGWTMATMFVNGIPSTGSILHLVVPAPAAFSVNLPARLPGGACQFCFQNAPGASFTVLAATNAALPLSDWIVLDSVTELSPGQFRFTDSQATNFPQRFYCVRSP
jgi:hypothetical protein